MKLAWVGAVLALVGGCSANEEKAAPRQASHACNPLAVGAAPTSYRAVYAATTEDGHRFLALAPLENYRTDNVRVFYGTPDDMRQREVLDYVASSAIHLTFDLDGKPIAASLIYCNSAHYFGKARLELPDRTVIPLTPMPGSPGAMSCPSYVDGGDAGAPTQPVADVTELVAGGQYLCF